MKENETKMPNSRLEFEINLISQLLKGNLSYCTRMRYEKKLSELLDKYYSK